MKVRLSFPIMHKSSELSNVVKQKTALCVPVYQPEMAVQKTSTTNLN